MTVMATEPVLDDLTMEVLETFEEFDIPCDYADHKWCPDQPAKWVAHVLCTECGYAGQRLICESCKERVVGTEYGMRCGTCNHLFVPARRAFNRFEVL